MNKIKFFISFALVLASFFFLTSKTEAVTKTSGNLEATFDEPIFSPTDIWYPGLSLSRDLIVKNNGSETETVIIASQNETETGNISQVFNFKVEEGGSTIYEDSLADFWNAGEVTLSKLSSGQTKTYQLTASMDSIAGNEYQDKKAVFDLLVGFLGKEAVTFVGGDGGAAGPAGPPVCSDTKPSTPTNFTAISGPGTGQVSLSWMAPSPPYTYFLIAYSDNSSWPPKWGNPDIGNVTSFTVSGLGSGTYWFWLRAGNGCMPGDFTGPVSPGAIVGILGAPVAVGFLPGVLGVKTPGELGETKATEAAEVGEVAGVGAPSVCPWWLILSLAEILLLGIYYWWLSRQKKAWRFWWLVPAIIAVLAFIGDQYIAHRYFTPSRFCNLMWLWASLGAILPTGFYLYFTRK